jgi:hypothetical protein
MLHDFLGSIWEKTPPILRTTRCGAVNSCASNSTTGETVCTANNTDVYLLSGTALNRTLTSGGGSVTSFSGGQCTTCSVTMDPVHNKAVIGLSLGGGTSGFQFLNLATSTVEPAFAAQANGFISEAPLIDPIRNLLLSATEMSDYEIVNVATSTSPTFFENPGLPVPGELDSLGEDCSTGIMLASTEFFQPSAIYLADLTQSAFFAGSPARRCRYTSVWRVARCAVLGQSSSAHGRPRVRAWACWYGYWRTRPS